MANNTWSNYTEKTATPVDADEVMARDSTDGKNKRLLFGTFWKWVAKKLNEATISELQTNNKTIIGAINALNSDSPVLRSIKIDGMNASNQTLYILEIGKLVQLSARFVAEKNFEAGSIIASDLPAPILDKDRVIKAYNSNGVETAIFNIASHKLILKTNLAPTTDVRIDMSYIC